MNKLNKKNVIENNYDLENNIDIINLYAMMMSIVVGVRIVMLLAVAFD
jgi:hypothetical protein